MTTGMKWMTAIGAGVALAAARPAAPQRAVGARPPAVLLRLRPQAGDKFRTRFEQSVRFQTRDGDQTPLPPVSAMTVFAHSVVERVDATGALVLAVTDSVALRASGAPAHATEAQRRALEGRRSRFRIAPDGSTALLGGADAMRFPAALPAGPVAPGAMWSRAMALPWRAPGAPAAAGATVDVWFRFDSLTRGGTLAFVSLRGAVRPDGAPAADAPAPGTVSGLMVIDLARGWVTDSRATFQLDGALSAPGGPPRAVRVVVAQRLVVLGG